MKHKLFTTGRANSKSQKEIFDCYYSQIPTPNNRTKYFHTYSSQSIEMAAERIEIDRALSMGYTHKLSINWVQVFHSFGYKVRVIAQPLEAPYSNSWHNHIILRDVDTMSNYEEAMALGLFQAIGTGVMRAYQRIPIDLETFKTLMTTNVQNRQVVISWGQQDLARISHPTQFPEPRREQTLYFQSLVNKEE